MIIRSEFAEVLRGRHKFRYWRDRGGRVRREIVQGTSALYFPILGTRGKVYTPNGDRERRRRREKRQ